MSLHVHIERVVLDGVPISGEQVDPFQKELQEALQTLLGASDPRQLHTRGSVARLHAPVVSLAGGVTPAGIGAQVAVAIASSIAGYSAGPTGRAASATSGGSRRAR
jgi:hypothetical protein